MDPSGRSVKSQFKVADREGAAWCVVVGDTELASGTVVLKDLRTAQQTTVPRDELVGRLRLPLPAGEG
jgi:histidyl-tRNA synthetase